MLQEEEKKHRLPARTKALLGLLTLGILISACLPAFAIPVIPTQTPEMLSATPRSTLTMTAMATNPIETTATATVTPLPPTATLSPTLAPQTDTAIEILMQPFVAERNRLRLEWLRTDPEYPERVDQKLNENRVNFLLYGYGDSHEPPATEKVLIGSHSILSYDLRTHQADIISLTHDLRAPELEEALKKKWGVKKVDPVKLDQAYSIGGFDLQRKTLEDATGLELPFQLVFNDIAVQRGVDEVFGGVKINLPKAFDVQPFYLGGKKYPAGHFDAGEHQYSGTQAVQLIITVPVSEGYYGLDEEHNTRKALVLTALAEALPEHCGESGFWTRAGTFTAKELLTREIETNIGAPFLVNNLGKLADLARSGASVSSLCSRGTGENNKAKPLVTIGKTIYIHDPQASIWGGAQWVGPNAVTNPYTRKDIQDGVYWGNPNPDMAIAVNCNPYAPKLYKDCWGSVRSVVRNALSDNN